MIEEPERQLAKLFHDTEGQFTREQYLELTDWDFNNWLCRPDANEGSEDRHWYWPVERVDPDDPPVRTLSGPRDLFMATRGEKMRILGHSPEEIEAACDKWLHPQGEGSGWKGHD